MNLNLPGGLNYPLITPDLFNKGPVPHVPVHSNKYAAYSNDITILPMWAKKYFFNDSELGYRLGVHKKYEYSTYFVPLIYNFYLETLISSTFKMI